MLILHAGALAGGLLLWGEASARPRAARAAASGYPTYPYDAGEKRVRRVLAGLLSRPEDLPAGARRVVLWAPTRGTTPLASSPLVAEPPAGRARLRTAPWRLGGLMLDPGQAVVVLATLGGRELLTAGVVAGPDFLWWVDALRLAGSLLARQRLLPSLVREAGVYRARWEPVPLDTDHERLAALAARMPGVARALSGDPTPDPPATPPGTVLAGFVAAVVDRLARDAEPFGLGLRPLGPRRREDSASLHDAWVRALRSPDDTLPGDPQELEVFAEAVDHWLRPVTLASRAPFRLSLRLEEPTAEPGSPDAPVPWRVRFLLQSRDDPSLLLPLADAWTARGREAALLKRAGGDVREYALTALAQAAALCPAIEAGLRDAVPDGFATDAEGAHRFLVDCAPTLQQAGFGLQLPAWWTGGATRTQLSVRARVKSAARAAGTHALGQVLEFQWQLALGDAALSLAELQSLAALKAPLVRLRGQWVEVDPDQLGTVLAELDRKGLARASAGEVVQMALGAGTGPAGLEVAGVDASGWVGDLLARLQGHATFAELAPPAGLTARLRPYQVRGYSWLAFLRSWGLGACLADDMGLGKTVQALALVQRDWESAEARRPTLLVCPTSVVGNWHKEVTRFAPGLPVLVHHGAGRRRQEDFRAAAEAHGLVISTYALLQRDLELLHQVQWAGVVLDEAQNVKNPETRQARAARALSAGYRIALTGTPVENHVGDLWSLMDFLNPGLLGTPAEFRRRYFLPIQVHGDPAAGERLRRLTSPFILRRLKTDRTVIADLPEKQEMKVYANLTREQASLYAAVLEEATGEIARSAGIERRGRILAMLTRLKQVCNHPAQFLADGSAIAGRSGKLALLEEVLAEVTGAGERALVFSQFAAMGAMLKARLQEVLGREVPFLHGGVPKARRDQMVERFQTEDGPPVFVLSLKAGGTGLNLTGANHVVHYDRWWNPAVEDQATDRVFRIGQTRNVQVRKLVCVGTFEERIDELIESKQDLARQVVGTGERWLTELSDRELRSVFALSREAVAG